MTEIHLFTGKGGVGKTTLAAAYATALCATGKRVLLLEIADSGACARLLQAPPTGYSIKEVQTGLHLATLTPQEAMREYALLVLRFEKLYNAIFATKWVRILLDVLPALSEMVLWGKIWYHAAGPGFAADPYDALVVDAPATGHCLAMLRTPFSVLEGVPKGLMRSHAAAITDMLQSSTTYLHVVTLPEQLPITEACELLAQLQPLNLHIAPLLLNHFKAPLSIDTLPPLTDPQLQPFAAVLLAHQEAAEVAATELLRLPAMWQSRCLTIPSLHRYWQPQESAMPSAHQLIAQWLAQHHPLLQKESRHA